MTDYQKRLLEMLGAIEEELRRIGYWKPDEIDPYEDLPEGEVPTFLNASSFEDWLQFVFLPNARSAIAKDQIPNSSSVGIMAMRQYDYHSHVPEAQQLVHLLHSFDRAIEKRKLG